ncbi:cytochrome P450 [Cokeromyces recurvatus]|uniref:cytochrome P450 n=1 Tax=Cokeromyces recurvatus TaxID=90255 RepID=UPI00221E7B7A|nr:cytochrome P450 [Cokeromyces recurvatus]KAI7904795.1 cytochrome P450 [Cokeromyces recurvatus]
MEKYYSVLLDRIETIRDRNQSTENITTIAGALAAIGFATYCIKRLFSKDKKTKTKQAKEYETIPSPKGAIYYLGHTPLLGKIPAHRITEWHRQLGPILRIQMGVQDWVFISDPYMAHDLFATQGTITSGRPYLTFGNGIAGIGGRGIVFADYGKKWKNARTAILKILSPKSVDGYESTIECEVERTVQQLIEQTKMHGYVNPIPFVRCLSMNIILQVGFGISGVSSPDDPLFKELVHIIKTSLYFTGAFRDMSTYFPFFSFLDVIFRRKQKMKAFFYNDYFPLFQRLVKMARESDQDNLVKKIDNIKDDLEIDDRNLTAIMSEVLIAGGDTVSVAASFTFAILCHYPDIQQKLANEIDDFIRKYHRIPRFDDRLELPYYIAFQKECLRYRPAVYFSIPRKANQDVIYKHFIIPKGTIMVSNIHTLHNDSTIFPHPEKFIPERFLNDTRTMYASSNGNIQNRDIYLFGWGRRICPGIYLAENELFNLVTKVMARCKIEPTISPTGEAIYPDLNDFKDDGATLVPSPFYIHFTERENKLVF